MPLIGNPLNKLARSISLSSAVAIALTAGMASPALADTTTYSPSTPTTPATTHATASATVKGGYLSETTDDHIYLSETTLDGRNVQISTGTTGWSFTDARGTGASWALTVYATDFTSTPDTSSTADTHTRTILANNLSLECGSGTVLSGSDAGAPTCSATTLKSAPQTVITAASDKKGTYNFTPTFTLQIPINAYRSNYMSGTSNPIPYVSTVTYTLG